MLKIAVLVSGGGSNLQSIINNIKKGYMDCSIEYVISDREGAYGIERAKKAGITAIVFDKKTFGNISDNIYQIISGRVDYIVLAGFLSILKGDLIREFKNRIINIHPSLIPSFCGAGMYGLNVHKKALEYGVKVSGCTVHFVDDGTDTGPIILQKTVQVLDGDTPESLQSRVLEQEHTALSEAIKLIAENRIKIIGRKVCILK
ncbi:MAG: phosphoribosylglycinamide formyltransferase [Bacillota bacterium]|nr:phosphoribosylglycinamide formyltransferase [Bacillota bacterium]